MRITLNELEIHEAIRDKILGQISLSENSEMSVKLIASRGAEGYTCEIEINTRSQLLASAATSATVKAPLPAPVTAPALEAAGISPAIVQTPVEAPQTAAELPRGVRAAMTRAANKAAAAAAQAQAGTATETLPSEEEPPFDVDPQPGSIAQLEESFEEALEAEENGTAGDDEQLELDEDAAAAAAEMQAMREAQAAEDRDTANETPAEAPSTRPFKTLFGNRDKAK